MKLYNCKVRLHGDVRDECRKKNVTSGEIRLLQQIHGEDAVSEITPTGAAPTAGTTVAGVTATPTATTGDVRGTYTPNQATDGAKAYQILIASADPFARGAVQYSV